ncbi:MAG TPA: ACP S-malonyltransferase [Candidatus Limnocylindria bacterium]|nr:ACP S-malonyltransferase [Candidatus Limnocylindria bacterium]
MSMALLFSPQGSQSMGMGHALADGSPAARATFDEADAVLGWSVSDLAWKGPEERLNDTRFTQPALFSTSLAALAALRERVELSPAFVAGHSVGEYAALVAAGVLPFADGLRLVARRGELMRAETASGGMTAVIGLDRETVASVVASVASPADLVVANDNAPGQVVISGTTAAIAAAEEPLKAAGARRVLPLKVSGPFHSPSMAPVSDALADAFEAVAWSEAAVPVVSNVTADAETDPQRLRNLLAEQVRSPVEWVASVRRMVDDGVDTFVECGPGNALSGMVRRIAPEARTLNVSDPQTLAAAVDALSVERAEASV